MNNMKRVCDEVWRIWNQSSGAVNFWGSFRDGRCVMTHWFRPELGLHDPEQYRTFRQRMVDPMRTVDWVPGNYDHLRPHSDHLP